MLTDVEREHLFLLGLGRPPEARYRKSEGVTPRLQRVLDALDPSPALDQDGDMGRRRLEPGGDRDADRLRRRCRRSSATSCASSSSTRAPAPRNTTGRAWRGSCWARSGWTRRAPAPRRRWSRWSMSSAGSVPSSGRCGATTTFAAAHGEAVKHIRHPVLGPLAFEFSTFAVDGRTGPQHGGLQSGDAGGRRTDQVAADIDRPRGFESPPWRAEASSRIDCSCFVLDRALSLRHA